MYFVGHMLMRVCVFVCECVYAYVRVRALLSAVSKGSHF